MIELGGTAVAAIGLFCGVWLAIAAWIAMRRRDRSERRRVRAAELARSRAMLDAAPGAWAIVERSGTIADSAQLPAMLQMSELPDTLDRLAEALRISPEALRGAVASCAASGSPFTQTAALADGDRTVLVQGRPAPAMFKPGAALLWLTDISEREQALAAARAERDRLSQAIGALSALIEAAPFPVWHRGPDLRLTMVNSAYVAAVEADEAMDVIERDIELIDDAEGRSAKTHAASVLDRGEPAARTVPATIAGERRMIRVVEVPIGQAGVGGYAIDVEDREQARADLGRFVRAQRDMLDRLSAGVAQFGPDRHLIFSNQPFARLFSLRGEFLADQPEFNRVLDAMRESGNLPEVRDFPEWKEERRRWFTSGLAADEEDWLQPGGKHLRVVAQPLPDGGLLLIFEDRTEQILLASARDTLLRVRTATFDNLFEAIGVFASDGRLALWNSRFRDLWQFEEEQLAAHPRVDAMTPHLARKLKNPNHAGLVRELVRSATVERKQRNGRVSLIDGRDFEFAAVPLPDGNALFTMLDVTDSRMIEAALRDRNEALEDADRLKTAFVSNMSYELRTPLTTISGFTEMLAGGYAGELPNTATEYVFAIMESVERLSALIDNVLDLTQSDTGSLLLVEAEIDVADMCFELAERARPAAVAKGLELVSAVDPAAGIITGDRQRLLQALGNILTNAIDYTEAGGRVLLNAGGDAVEAEIAISDSGRGISAGDQSRVFDRFHRNAPHVTGEAALGLGLPLAKQFIEAHGGSIALHSEPGVGTTVTVRLPRASP